MLKSGSYRAVTYAPTKVTGDLGSLEPRPHASNELMVEAKYSATGHPLLVGGPQVGYFYPGLTYEIDMHAPGLDWRGATSAPFPGYMLIGRGADFATTLTSASADDIDQFAETLCGGSKTKYMYKGTCRAMQRFDAGTVTTAKGTSFKVSFWTTVNGPVIGYANAGGKTVAITSKRASYGKDVALTLSGIPFFGPVAAARVGYIDGDYVLNPTADADRSQRSSTWSSPAPPKAC